ncbi:hypothetical protein Syun_022309 [Stephania yunnanensis]|uniref:tRNA (adenine(58)-N(1))-methyltransferase n=1 Tax=Stephania yunnanensis TaxID=152371 RepID=A0AAP0FIA7_9MAGN
MKPHLQIEEEEEEEAIRGRLGSVKYIGDDGWVVNFVNFTTDFNSKPTFDKPCSIYVLQQYLTVILCINFRANRFGVFKHSDWIGKPFGSKVLSNKGGFVYLLAPTPELWTLVLSHRTQILYIADISFVVMYLEIVPGCVVLESGTGSGSLTTSLARAVAPCGHVYTFDFHEQRAAAAKFSIPDLPQPWLTMPSAAKMLKQDAVLCSFSPCIEQVQRSCETLKKDFTDIRTFEVLLRTYEVKEGSLDCGNINKGDSPQSLPCKRKQSSSRSSNGTNKSSATTVMAKPCSEAKGHTGYLTFARLKCLY